MTLTCMFFIGSQSFLSRLKLHSPPEVTGLILHAFLSTFRSLSHFIMSLPAAPAIIFQINCSIWNLCLRVKFRETPPPPKAHLYQWDVVTGDRGTDGGHLGVSLAKSESVAPFTASAVVGGPLMHFGVPLAATPCPRSGEQIGNPSQRPSEHTCWWTEML